MLKRTEKRGFTLAEVLIVIAVIGVVAAITIPTLINTISKNAKKSQTEVIEARLLDGINRYSATDDGLSQKYASTYDFLVGLSAHYKMSQICKADEIEKCIPYDKIYSSDGTDIADISSLKTIDTLVAGDAANNYLAPASFISAQGTPVIMALKKNCAWDMGTAMRSIEDSGCIVYMYDKNGTGLPNKMGTDIVNHGLSIKGFPLAVLNGVKIMTNVFAPEALLTESDCITNKAKYGITYCFNYNKSGPDYWGGAMKYCKDLGYHLPTEQQLTDIANALYPSKTTSATGVPFGEIDTASIPSALSGLTTSFFILWSDSENGNNNSYANIRGFATTYSSCSNRYRGETEPRAVCVAD